MDYFPVLCTFSLIVVTLADMTCTNLTVNGSLIFHGDLNNTEGDVVQFSCKGGLRLVGEPYAVCTDGEFYVSQYPVCQDECNHAKCKEEYFGYCNERKECVCRPGYSFSDSNCTEKTSVKTRIILDADWKIDYINKSSTLFLLLQADICASFDQAFKNVSTIAIRCYTSFLQYDTIEFTVANVINDFTEESEVDPFYVEGVINDAAVANPENYTVPGMLYNFKNETEAQSIDFLECEEESNICDRKYGVCENTEGGNYMCSCIYGTYQSEDIQVDGTYCSVVSIKIGLVVGLGIVCGIAVACCIPSYLWFIISPAFEKLDYNTAIEQPDISPEGQDLNIGNQDQDQFVTSLKDDEEMERQLTLHRKFIQNMTNVGPVPRFNMNNHSQDIRNSIELSQVNSTGNVYNQPSQ